MINSFKNEYAFLSNFYPARIKWEGIIYPTAENAYQSCKTKEEDDAIRYKLAMVSPAEAKRIGKKIKVRSDWTDAWKLDVMNDILFEKFYRNEDLRRKLIETGEEELIEENTWNDTFWGICNGIGENNLGKILMTLREELKNV